MRGLLETDFASEFAAIVWNVENDAERMARDLPPFAAEALFFAAREAARNAVRYARGQDAGRALTLTISLERQAGRLRLEIRDDGVGPGEKITQRDAQGAHGATSAGSGLRIHSAMLAAVGGSLEINAGAGECGTSVILLV